LFPTLKLPETLWLTFLRWSNALGLSLSIPGGYWFIAGLKFIRNAGG
jgi:hypothetical protein